MRQFCAHVRRLWPGAGILLPLPFVAWPVFCFAIGEGRPEHILFATVIPFVAYATPRTKAFFLGVMPLAILGVVYDAMRYVKDVGVSPSRVHLCDLRALEHRLFGYGDGATVHDWLSAHASLPLDLLCAIPYATYICVALGSAAWLYVRHTQELARFSWTLLVLNVVAFITYHLYPAAPPWYFHAHGCVIDMATHASEGPNLARVDAFLGIHGFAVLYGRSSDIFGAVPSLHVAYPLLALLFVWRYVGNVARALIIAFCLLMDFAAVYLDHHWVIDVLLGLGYTVVTERAVAWLWSRRSDQVLPTAGVARDAS